MVKLLSKQFYVKYFLLSSDYDIERFCSYLKKNPKNMRYIFDFCGADSRLGPKILNTLLKFLM